MSRHETTDVNVRSIGVVVAVFVVVTVIIHLAVWWLFTFYQNQEGRRDVRRTLIEMPSVVPPEPRLQVNPYEDLARYRESQQKILNSYEWASREQGRVRMPIERAMELVVERKIENGNRD